jgi:hypothetical protein
VSPLHRLDSLEKRDSYLTTVLATFASDRIDIQIKRQNTAAFLIAESKAGRVSTELHQRSLAGCRPHLTGASAPGCSAQGSICLT